MTWRTVKVFDLIRDGLLFVEDGNHGEYRPLQDEIFPANDAASRGMTPFVRPPDLQGGRVDFSRCDRISEEARSRVRKGIGMAGDTLLTHRATVGRVARVQADAPVFVANPGVTVWRSLRPDILSPAFLYVAVQSPDFMTQLWRLAGDTDIFPYVSLTQQRGMTLRIPALREQRAIAHILGTLDDKIELNRRMNETLEAMARALFKSWFVDFDPVRAKAEGRQPSGMDAETAKLFPSEFEQSELGEIPKGWRVTDLADVADLNPSESIARGVAAPYIEMSSLPTSGHRAERWPAREVGSGARFRNGDTLFARITPCLENGKTGYVDMLEDGVVGWGSTEYIVIRPRQPLPSEWGYILAREARFREFAVQKMEGSTGRQRVSARSVGTYPVCAPETPVARAFEAMVRPLFQRMTGLADEVTTLGLTRDALLPRLLSGELDITRVADALGSPT